MSVASNGMAPLLQVFDMNASLAFYRDALGFEIVDASPEVETPEGKFSHWMWLRLGPAHLMLNTAYDEGERPSRPMRSRRRWHGDVCLYFNCDDVDAVHATLRRRLPKLEEPRDAPYGMRQLYLSDPDGYGVCFQASVIR